MSEGNSSSLQRSSGSSSSLQTNSLEARGKLRGVFGFGLSNNENLDFLNLVVLAVAGIIIKLCFSEVGGNKKRGVTGSASNTIWGYGLTAISLFIMMFLSLNLNLTSKQLRSTNEFHHLIDNISIIDLAEIWPILFTFLVILYIISLNFIFYRRINSGSVSSTYNVYDTFSTILIILQIGLIIKYVYLLLNKISQPNRISNIDDNKISIIKSLSLILVTINFIFALIINIILGFFSTDG
tara:strand:- start:5215 stop:5931 length:717 start_codon:yes stop_codon:yes gene_type:complete